MQLLIVKSLKSGGCHSSFSIQRGARVAQIVFEEVKGRAEVYSGKYRGGKVV